MTLLLERVFQRFRDLKAERESPQLRRPGARGAGSCCGPRPGTEPRALLLVDEYQDINPVQEAFLEALQARRTVLVGDPKQAIYGFRGGRSGAAQEASSAWRRLGGPSACPSTTAPALRWWRWPTPSWRRSCPRLDPASVDPDGTQEHAGQRAREPPWWPCAGIPSAKRGSDLAAASAPGSRPWRRPAGWEPRRAFPEPALAAARPAAASAHGPGRAAPRPAGPHIEPLVQSREGFWDSPGVRLLMALAGSHCAARGRGRPPARCCAPLGGRD